LPRKMATAVSSQEVSIASRRLDLTAECTEIAEKKWIQETSSDSAFSAVNQQVNYFFTGSTFGEFSCA
jgi:hypothetical protein